MQVLNQEVKEKYGIYNGDNVELIKQLPDNSIHYTIFSPPFASLYTYSNSERDMGNCQTDEEFAEHFSYLIKELYRVTMPGRLLSFHCMEIPATKQHDGYIGIKDFPGQLIRMFEKEGFIFHSRVTIWKDPLIAATRTHALGLLHKQIVKDSSMCRQGIADYVITMRKPGDNPEFVSHEEGFKTYIGTDDIDDSKVFSHQVWRKYASPVWMDINQTRTLNTIGSKDEKDSRHICPLQLDVVERCIHLWTNPGDIVFDPFAGIGTVPYCAVNLGRRGLGFELKESYYQTALNNMADAQLEGNRKQMSIFDME